MDWYSTKSFTDNGSTEFAICVGYVDSKTMRYCTKWIPRSVAEIKGGVLYVQRWWADRNNFLPEM